MPNEHDLALVRSILAQAGIAPDDEELAGLAAGYPGLRAQFALLHDEVGGTDEEPEAVFLP